MEQEGTFTRDRSERITRRFLVGGLCFGLLMGGVGCGAAVLDEGSLSVNACIMTDYVRQRFGNPKQHSGIRYNQAAGVGFQKVALANLPGLRVVKPNWKTFKSEERGERTKKRFKGVKPDAVLGATQGSPYPFGPVITTHPESTFIEVKAVKGAITPGYANWQTIGLLDALSNSPAASDRGPNRAYPSLYFITTGDTSITEEVVNIASVKKILVWISCVADVHGTLFVQPPRCLNCSSVFDNGYQTQGVQVGPFFPFPELGDPGMGGLDEPILDDGLVGYPGVPGKTSPNPGEDIEL